MDLDNRAPDLRDGTMACISVRREIYIRGPGRNHEKSGSIRLSCRVLKYLSWEEV